MIARPLSAAVLSFAAAASAQQPLPDKQTQPGFYRLEDHDWRQMDVVRRKGFASNDSLSLDGDPRWLYCAIPPGADWAVDSQEQHVQEGYIRYLASAFYHDKDRRHDPKDCPDLATGQTEPYRERDTGVVGLCGAVRSPTARVDLKRINCHWWKVCNDPAPAVAAGRWTCTARTGGIVHPPEGPIMHSLRVLAKSRHEKVATSAMSLMEQVRGRDKLFAKTISEVLLDASAPVKVRERAAEALASVLTQDDLSAHTLATIWGGASTPESLKRAALRAFSLVLSFSDPRRAGGAEGERQAAARKQCWESGQACDRLGRYLRPLMALVQAETKEDEQGKDKLTPLGEDALCVARQFGARSIWYAKRHQNWHAVMKADEAKGIDQSQPDGKLKKG